MPDAIEELAKTALDILSTEEDLDLTKAVSFFEIGPFRYFREIGNSYGPESVNKLAKTMKEYDFAKAFTILERLEHWRNGHQKNDVPYDLESIVEILSDPLIPPIVNSATTNTMFADVPNVLIDHVLMGRKSAVLDLARRVEPDFAAAALSRYTPEFERISEWITPEISEGISTDWQYLVPAYLTFSSNRRLSFFPDTVLLILNVPLQETAEKNEKLSFLRERKEEVHYYSTRIKVLKRFLIEAVEPVIEKYGDIKYDLADAALKLFLHD